MSKATLYTAALAALLLSAPTAAQVAPTDAARADLSADLIVGDEFNSWCWQRPVCQQASHAVMHAGLAWGLDKAFGSWIDDREAAWISAGLGFLWELRDVIDYGTDDGGPFGRWDALADVTFRVGGGFSVHLLP